MDSEMEKLAASAATALIGLMISDSWKGVKERFSRLFSRRNPLAAAADLDEARAELVALPTAARGELAGDIEVEWRARFQRLLRQDASAIDEMRALLDALAPGPDPTERTSVHNTVLGGVHRGPVVQSGRITNLHVTAPSPT
ncbi:hypothetical protein [Streptacidiphilus anmyonensis]|uniref:hypothetical protein n=1 Tax=Streptacidiphilus anmyonensis TaxID=405782 RepID=UPI0005A61B9A|nr:hypothetical protein [Streptacidiphilus anmyonensis]